jgi:hypothetical protein
MDSKRRSKCAPLVRMRSLAISRVLATSANLAEWAGRSCTALSPRASPACVTAALLPSRSFGAHLPGTRDSRGLGRRTSGVER